MGTSITFDGQELAVAPADKTHPRIDLVARKPGWLGIIQGTPHPDPIPPELPDGVEEITAIRIDPALELRPNRAQRRAKGFDRLLRQREA